MKLIVCADADPSIGSGHAMRCLALADEWSRRDQAVLIAQSLHDTMRKRWEAHGHEVVVTRDWRKTMARHRPDAIVLDRYRAPVRFQRDCAAIAPTLLVDDHAQTRRDPAVAVTDGNLIPGKYASPALTGPSYALLRPGLGPAQGRGLLITLGGAAPVNLVQAIIDAVPSGTLILGGMQSDSEKLRRRAEGKGLTVVQDIEDMAFLIRQHSHAITAAGTTVLELAACGIPCLAVPYAGNQFAVSSAVEQLGLGSVLSSRSELPQALSKLVATPLYRPVVDGRGARRVCAWLRGQVLDLRPAVETDKDQVLEWSNDLTSRAMAFSSHTISRAEHDVWWKRRTNDPAAQLWIGEHEGPVGFIWFDAGSEAVVSVNVAPGRRAQGWGPALIRRATDAFQALHPIPVVAAVRHVNRASRSAFLDAGYFEISGRDAFPASWVFQRNPE